MPDWTKGGWKTAARLKNGEQEEHFIGHYGIYIWWNEDRGHYTVSISDERRKNTLHQWFYHGVVEARQRFVKSQRRVARLLALDALGLST